MLRTIGAVVLAATASLGLMLLPPTAARGGVDQTYLVTGTGSITPGLPCYGCSIDFSFTVFGATGVHTGCFFSGSSNGLEDDAGGNGGGSISGCDISGSVFYVRAATSIVQLHGDVTIDGQPGSITSSALVFVPTSKNPTTSFALTGVVTVGAAPVPTVPPTPTVTPPSVLPSSPPSSSCNRVDTAGVCVNVVPGSVVRTVSLAPPQSSGSAHVVGSIDMYSVPLPIGGSATFPCVVLSVDATSTGGCAVVPGATKVSTVATLVDTYASGATPVVTVNVCAATITATVQGFGVRDVPGDTIC